MRFLLIRTTQGFSIFLHHPRPDTIPYPFAPSLDLLYIASQLEHQGQTVTILDLGAEPHPRDAIHHNLPGTDYAILNIAYGTHLAEHHLADLIHTYDPDLPILLTGTYCRTWPGRALQDIPTARLSIDTEAEFLVPDLLQTLTGRQEPTTLPGISYHTTTDIKSTPATPHHPDLDSLPFPARHLVTKYHYGRFNGVPLSQPPFTNILTSRGCPNHCRFCTTHVTSPTFRTRSSENVAAELNELEDSYHSIMIEDNNFLADTKRASHILDTIIQHGSPFDLYIIGARVDTASPQLYQKLRQAGVKFISYGLESGTQEMLDYYSKGITLDQIRTTINLAAKTGLLTWGNFILGAPHETRDHLQETIRFASSIPLDLVFFRTLSYQYGSDLWNDAVKQRKIDPHNIDPVPAGTIDGLGKLSTHEFENLTWRAMRNYYLHPSYILRELLHLIKYQDPTMLQVLRSLLKNP